MDAGLRRAIAYIAVRAISQSNTSHVYDHNGSKNALFSGNVDGQNCNVYDHDRRCHVSGTLPSLYDFGNQRHVTLNVSGKQFSGFDYASSKHFTGNVNGSTISIFDYDDQRHHNFSA